MSLLQQESCYIRTENNDIHVDVQNEIGYSKVVNNFRMAMTGKSRQYETDRKSAP